MDTGEEILLPILFKRCTRLIDHAIDNTLKQHDIARSQYRVLYYAANYGEPTQTELMEAMEIQASTLTLIVDALVRKGWLVRFKDSRDRRINKLRLTREGQKHFERMPDPARKLHQIILKGLGKEEARGLELSLKKVINQLS